jgi:hypothetical protein
LHLLMPVARPRSASNFFESCRTRPSPAIVVQLGDSRGNA